MKNKYAETMSRSQQQGLEFSKRNGNVNNNGIRFNI